MSSRRIDERDIEEALRDLGSRYGFPPTRDLLPAVRARIAERPRGSGLWPSRPALAPALLTLLVLAIGTLALQPIASTAAEALGLRGITIFRVPTAPAPTAVPAPTGATAPTAAAPRLPDARRVASVDEASRVAGFRVLVPAELGTPDEVYVRAADGQMQVSLVYLARPGIPVSAFAGVSVLVTEVRGALELALLGKAVPPGTTVSHLRVDGGAAIWMEGQPHQFFYRDPSGNVVVDTLRLAGNVLVWERDGLLLRIEAEVDQGRATGIASSMR